MKAPKATLNFPEVLKFNIEGLSHLSEDRIQQLAFQHCMEVGLRPSVIRFIVSDAPSAPYIDVEWQRIVLQQGLEGLDLAVADPIQGNKTKDVDIGRTAEFYNLPYKDVRVRLGQDAGTIDKDGNAEDEDEAS